MQRDRKVVIGVRLEPAIAAELWALARWHGTTVSQIIRESLARTIHPERGGVVHTGPRNVEHYRPASMSEIHDYGED